MKKSLLAAGIGALALMVAPLAQADTIKATVGHMCCGGCRAAASAGLKNVAWADNVAIEGTTVTVTSKAGSKADVVALVDALNKCGFPASSITASGPVTLTVAHLCCGGCVSALKEKLAAIPDARASFDKDNVKIDQASRTVILQPAAGKELNLVTLLTQLQRTGFSASSCLVGTTVASAK